MNQSARNIFSFRAECQPDVLGFLGQGYSDPERPYLRDVLALKIERFTGDADLKVEIHANPSINIDTIRGWMNQVADSHVMLETLREVPLAENSLERDPNYARQRPAG